VFVERVDVHAQPARVFHVACDVLRVFFEAPVLAQQLPVFGNQTRVLPIDRIFFGGHNRMDRRAPAAT
jgi:hypothetical protein